MIKLNKNILAIITLLAVISNSYLFGFAEIVKYDSQAGILTSANVNMRSGPGTNYIALLQIPYQDIEVTILEKDGSWYKVDYKGNKGWIVKDFIHLINPKPTITAIPVVATADTRTDLTSRSNNDLNSRTDALRLALVESAKKCIGIKYVWGGYGEKGNPNAPDPQKGVDCSGFAYYIYSIYNIKLNGGRSTAAWQATEGEAVEKEDLKPGDLIFYQGPYDYEISHVAIYIGENEEGVKQIIHASSYAGEVTITDFDKQPNFKTARRIIQD